MEKLAEFSAYDGVYDMSLSLDDYVRKVPDYPHPGILFYDVTSIFRHPEAFSYCVDQACAYLRGRSIEAVAAIESRGLVIGAPISYCLKKPLILLRKAGKLPGPVLSRFFTLEYGTEKLEVQPHDVSQGAKLVLVDDLLATGGTVNAAIELLEESGGKVTELFTIIELLGLLRHDFSTLQKTSLLQY